MALCMAVLSRHTIRKIVFQLTELTVFSAAAGLHQPMHTLNATAGKMANARARRREREREEGGRIEHKLPDKGKPNTMYIVRRAVGLGTAHVNFRTE